MNSSFLQESRFADVQDLRFETGKRWDMGSSMLQEARFADFQESRFSCVYFQICILLSCKTVD